MSDMTVVEVNGIKLEVDLRYAKRIDTLRVGSKVKVLVKSDYAEPDVHTGVVVGFEPFESLPTVIICYLKVSYSAASLEFAYVNSKSGKKYDIIVAVDDDLPVKKADVLAQMDVEVEKKRQEIAEIERKRAYFLQHFNAYFSAPKKTS